MNGSNNIERLFREQFEGYRAEPSPGFWPKLNRKLQWQEFLRFGWDRFNVYYAGAALVAAGVALGIMLTGGMETETKTTTRDSVRINGPAEKQETSPQTREEPVLFEHLPESSRVRVQEPTTGEWMDVPEVTPEKTTETPSDTPRRQEPVETLQEEGEEVFDVPEAERKGLDMLPPVADYHIAPLHGCAPLAVMCVNLSQHADSCTWYFGDGGISHHENPSYLFDEPGTYPVSLRVMNEAGESVLARDTVKVYPRPEAAFEISPENPDLPGEPVFFYNYSRNAASYLWHFGDGHTSDAFEPLHKYDQAGGYDILLVAYSEGGCVDSALVTDAFGVSDCSIVFPNAFRPDPGGPTGGYYNPNDPSNTVFHPVCRGVDEYRLRIFNRTGALVFESDRVEIGWDGYINGTPARQDVYVWKARGTCINGKSFVKHGNLTLIWDRQ